MTGDADAIRQRVRDGGLEVLGGFHPGPEDGVPAGVATLLLLGPREPGFWKLVSASPEFADGGPDPLDRWSTRVIGDMAREVGAVAFFPFGDPPRPFLRWAIRSGEAWGSEVHLLVHARAGLLVSYRGALGVPERLALPAPARRPCDTCAARPCRTACPVGALTPERYDVAACRAHVASPAGTECRTRGCLVRRACPVSAGHPREDALSAHHMRHFA